MAMYAGQTSAAGVFEAYILRKFVDMLKPELVFPEYAEKASIPKGAGSYICNWNLPQTHAGTVTALSESAVDATEHEITNTTITLVTGSMADYGDWMKITSLAKAANLSQTMDAYSEQMAEMGANVIDQLHRNAAMTSTSFLHAGDTATGGATMVTGDKLKLKDFPVIAGFFRGNNAKGFQALGGDYMLAIHPNCEVDLVTDVTTTALSWSEANKYVPEGYSQLVDNHKFVGRFNGVTCLRTTQITTLAEDVTSAFANIALARWGIGNTGLGQSGPSKPTIKYKEPGNADTYQPLDRYCTLGWTVRMVAKLLDVNRALVVYSEDL